MAGLHDRVENALNETRMLILAAQVLIGFQYESVFEPGFDRLPTVLQDIQLIGLGLMLVGVGLLIAPGAFHQIVEHGEDTRRLTDFTGRIATAALMPFALAIGVELFVATNLVLGALAAAALGGLGAACALFFWYGLEWTQRMPQHNQQPSNTTRTGASSPPRTTPLDIRIKHVLTEARVVLPGVQALLGFQLVAMFTDAFEKLPQSSKLVHLGSLAAIALSIILLMAPAAYHRLVARGEDTEQVHAFSSWMVVAAMVPLALSITGDAYVVLAKVLGSTPVALGLAGVTLAFFYGLWFGLTLTLRRRQRRDQTRALRPAAAR